MRTKKSPSHSAELSFIEAARREQIISAAVDTIAEVGYAQTSIGLIAKRMGVSKGVITYHVPTRDALMGLIVADVLADFASFVRPRVDAETTAAGIIRVFIEASAAYMQANAHRFTAFLEIVANARDSQGKPLAGAQIIESDVANLEQLLRKGQTDGEFRDFDPHVMASSIIVLRNSMLQALAANPDIDLMHYARELATSIELATRRETHREEKQ